MDMFLICNQIRISEQTVFETRNGDRRRIKGNLSSCQLNVKRFLLCVSSNRSQRRWHGPVEIFFWTLCVHIYRKRERERSAWEIEISFFFFFIVVVVVLDYEFGWLDLLRVKNRFRLQQPDRPLTKMEGGNFRLYKDKSIKLSWKYFIHQLNSSWSVSLWSENTTDDSWHNFNLDHHREHLTGRLCHPFNSFVNQAHSQVRSRLTSHEVVVKIKGLKNSRQSKRRLIQIDRRLFRKLVNWMLEYFSFLQATLQDSVYYPASSLCDCKFKSVVPISCILPVVERPLNLFRLECIDVHGNLIVWTLADARRPLPRRYRRKCDLPP